MINQKTIQTCFMEDAYCSSRGKKKLGTNTVNMTSSASVKQGFCVANNQQLFLLPAKLGNKSLTTVTQQPCQAVSHI